MRTLSLIFVLILLSTALQAQNSTLSINASSETEVPADRISFHIQMNAEADSPQEAYELHKEKEEVLVELLKKHEVPEKDIRFDPVSIHKRSVMDERERKTVIATNQRVTLMLDDFSKYEEIQVTLIENNFNEFSGQFLSSKIKEGEDEALKKAIRTARKKAEVIVGETGGTIGSIKKINYSYNSSPPVPLERMEMRLMDQNGGSLLNFDQTVKVMATISIEYRIRHRN